MWNLPKIFLGTFKSVGPDAVPETQSTASELRWMTVLLTAATLLPWTKTSYPQKNTATVTCVALTSGCDSDSVPDLETACDHYAGMMSKEHCCDSAFYRLDALRVGQPTVSKHRRNAMSYTLVCVTYTLLTVENIVNLEADATVAL